MKTIVITGATSGIGYAVCRAFAGRNWAVLGVGRSDATCAAARQKLEAEFPNADIRFFPCDLSKQADILRLGDALMHTLAEKYSGKLDALVNNAGCVRNYYTTTEDGYETVFAVNHLAPFLLTKLLLPALQAAQGRMLVTSSQSHKWTKVRWDDVMLSRRYRPLLAYKQSKLCNLLFALECNHRFAGRGVRCYGIDPGLVAYRHRGEEHLRHREVVLASAQGQRRSAENRGGNLCIRRNQRQPKHPVLRPKQAAAA